MCAVCVFCEVYSVLCVCGLRGGCFWCMACVVLGVCVYCVLVCDVCVCVVRVYDVCGV